MKPFPIGNFLKKNRLVAILGKGVSGQAAAQLLEAKGVFFDFFDQTEDKTFPAYRYPLVIVSPGFGLKHPWVQLAKKSHCFCLPEIELARRFWEGKCIAVTGTNGKSTMAEFLSFALRTKGIDAYAVGNNGHAFSQLVMDMEMEDSINTYAVCEVSSFQAEALQAFEADAVFWTSFSSNHLDRHKNLEDYFKAKWNLIECIQKKDSCAFYFSESVFNFVKKMKLDLPLNVIYPPRDLTFSSPKKGAFALKPQRGNLALLQPFWREKFGKIEELLSLAEAFYPLPHRLQWLGCIGFVDFWNDAKSTTTQSTLSALGNFSQKVFWIGGGKSKGENLEKFVEELASKLKKAFLIGTTAEELNSLCQKFSIEAEVCPSLEQATKIAFEAAKVSHSPEIVILSPGFSSLDQFSNYAERGERFEATVAGLCPTRTKD